MTQEEVTRMAHETGIIPWCQMHWSANQFVTIDEGMDGDLTCLMQFAALVAAAEREACAKVCDHMASRCNDIRTAALEVAAENIRARSQL